MDIPSYQRLIKKRLEEFYFGMRDYEREDMVLMSRIEGLMEAGIALNAVTKRDLELLVDNVHFDVFGKSLAERRKDERERDCLDQNYDAFDLPSWQRV